MIENIQVIKKSGEEMFVGMEQSLLDFWAWAHSDIASNAERGKLAEYIVKCSLQVSSSCRVEWDAVDVISPQGIKVEVKSSAYLQTWKQTKASAIRFDIAPKYAWDSNTNIYSEERQRNSDVYVFCLFASTEAKTANPLNLGQWEFYVLNTHVLNERVPLQKSISLKSLLSLGAKKTTFGTLAATIKDIADFSKK